MVRSGALTSQRLPAALFVLFGLLTSLFLAWNLPPFQAADELSHVLRADMTRLGQLAGERVETAQGLRAGGRVQQGLITAHQPFDNIAHHQAEKADIADYANAAGARWSEGEVALAVPTAAMAPFLYLPASWALGLGQAAKLSPVQALYMARIAGALAAVAIGCAALMYAGHIRYLLFAIMLLPMSTALYGSVTPDGLMIALSALAAAVLSRAISADRPLTSRELAVVAGCLLALGIAKTPYAFLSLALAWAPCTHPRQRYAALALVLGGSLAWALFAGAFVQTPLENDGSASSDIGVKLAFLFSDPTILPIVAWRTLAENGAFYVRSFLGTLGALDTLLPGPYYAAALTVIVAGGALALTRGASDWRRFKGAALGVVLVTAAMLFGVMYLLWTPLGSMAVDGLQGRYFLPLAIFAAVAAEGPRPLLANARLRSALAATVLAFPLLSHLIVERAIILRYFLD